MFQERVTFLSMRMRHFVYGGSRTVCPFYRNLNFKNGGVKKNMQPLFCCCSHLQQHRPSNSKAIAYRQIFQQCKGKLIDLMLIYYTTSPVLQVRSFFPFNSANKSQEWFQASFLMHHSKSPAGFHPRFCWLVTTIEVLSGIIPPHLMGFKWLWPSPFRI